MTTPDPPRAERLKGFLERCSLTINTSLWAASQIVGGDHGYLNQYEVNVLRRLRGARDLCPLHKICEEESTNFFDNDKKFGPKRKAFEQFAYFGCDAKYGALTIYDEGIPYYGDVVLVLDRDRLPFMARKNLTMFCGDSARAVDFTGGVLCVSDGSRVHLNYGPAASCADLFAKRRLPSFGRLSGEFDIDHFAGSLRDSITTIEVHVHGRVMPEVITEVRLPHRLLVEADRELGTLEQSGVSPSSLSEDHLAFIVWSLRRACQERNINLRAYNDNHL